MSKPIVQRDDFWGDFVNGLFFRPVLRSRPAVQREDSAASAAEGLVAEDSTAGVRTRRAESEWEPSILIRERIPGADIEDIDIKMGYGALIIRADVTVLSSDGSLVPYSREIPLPPEVVSDHVRAEFADGVVTIRIPLHSPTTSARSTAPAPVQDRPRDAPVQSPTTDPAVPRTVTRWLKVIGDHVDLNEPLVEITTGMEEATIQSPKAGSIEKILVAEGQTFKLGAPLVHIREDDRPLQLIQSQRRRADNPVSDDDT